MNKNKKIRNGLTLLGIIISIIVSMNVSTSVFAQTSSSTYIRYTQEKQRAKGIRIANPVKTLWVGDNYRFTIVANKYKTVSVSWESSDSEIAEINSKTGELTAKKVGTVIISAINQDTGRKASNAFNIKEESVLKEVPREWYGLHPDGFDGDYILYFNEKYKDEFIKCEEIALPDTVDGKVYSKLYSLHFAGFINLKRIKFGKYTCIDGLSDLQLEEIQFPTEREDLFWLPRGLGTRGQHNIAQFHIPEKVKKIYTSDFNNCSSLEEFVFPRNVERLYLQNYEEDYLRDKTPLAKVHLGGGFRGNPKVKGYQVDGNNENLYSLDGTLFEREETGLVLHRYPVGRSYKSYYTPEDTIRINEYAFAGATKLTHLTIAEGTKSIGTYAFYQCKNLKELVIPASVTKFGGYNGKNFDGMWEIDPDYKAINNENAPIMDNATKKKVVIVTPKGSAAEKYAKKHKIKYKNN